MKKLLLTVISGLLCVGHAAGAQTLSFHSDGSAADFRCPAVVSRPASSRSSSSDSDEVMEPPALYELSEMGDAAQEEAIPPLFGSQLRQVDDRPLSMVFWGDSHLAAHFFSDEMIRLSGLPRSKIETTFIPATMGRPGVRLPIRKSCQGGGWAYRMAFQDKLAGGNYAQGLSALASSTPNSFLWVDFRQQPQTPILQSVDLVYSIQEGSPAVLGVSVDDGAEQTLQLDAEGGGVLQVAADQAMSTIKIRLVSGSIAIEGFVPHYLETRPALLLDTFAIPGATFRGWSNANPDYLKERIGKTRYDVAVFEFGTNEGNTRSFDAAAYREDLRASLTNMRRVLPDAQCILMGPADRGVLVRHLRSAKKGRRQQPVQSSAELLRFARIHQEISSIQRGVGSEFGCSSWSWQDAMGGVGSAYKWFYHSPRWMSPDLTHLTIPGYQMTAKMFADSIQFRTWVSSYTNAQ